MPNVIVMGVAGAFVALGVVALGLMGAGHGLTAFGQTFNEVQITNAGASLSGWGEGVVVLLAILAIATVAIFALKH